MENEELRMKRLKAIGAAVLQCCSRKGERCLGEEGMRFEAEGEMSNVKWLMSNGKGERWKAKVQVKVKGMEVGGLRRNAK
jgi:hypothetical protein